jgi:hypothetical protein
MRNCICGHTRRKHIGRIVNTYFCREMGCKCDNYKEAAKGGEEPPSPKKKVSTKTPPRKSLKPIDFSLGACGGDFPKNWKGKGDDD